MFVVRVISTPELVKLSPQCPVRGYTVDDHVPREVWAVEVRECIQAGECIGSGVVLVEVARQCPEAHRVVFVVIIEELVYHVEVVCRWPEVNSVAWSSPPLLSWFLKLVW